jgi:DNA mismatch repair protein MutL
VTHYALAHPEIAFTLTNNGRETLRAAQANDLRERAYQVFGAEFLENLLEVNGGHEMIARVRGFVSAPRERRTSRDNQFLFVNGRFVRDRLVSRALSEGYRSILPHGVYPVALLFLAIPLEEVDVNVHPAKTEVRFRRAAAVSDSVREAVRGALASGGFVRATDVPTEPQSESNAMVAGHILPIALELDDERSSITVQEKPPWSPWSNDSNSEFALTPEPRQPAIEFGFEAPTDDLLSASSTREEVSRKEISVQDSENRKASESPDQASPISNANRERDPALPSDEQETRQHVSTISASSYAELKPSMPPVDSAAGLVREVPLESVSTNIRPLGQLDESFIIATDDEGLLLIDQHVAHERILFDKFNHLEASRPAESQQLLIPETFDLTPAQAASFDSVSDELESYGFGLMRLSGRTVAIKAVPADLPQSEARNMLAEVLDTIDSEKRGAARTTLREEIAASLACRAAIKVNMPLSPEKMRWLIDRLLLTSSPTTCPHGRPVILRLATRDILKGFHRI